MINMNLKIIVPSIQFDVDIQDICKISNVLKQIFN